MKTPLTNERIRNHLTYSWWKYALLIVLAIFGWNITYSITNYRAPEEKKVVVNLYVYGDQDALDAYIAEVHETQMADMEEMYTIYTMLDDTYGEMIFSTHVAAGEGDIYLIDRDHFQRYAASDTFLPLEGETEMVAKLEEAGISLSQGWRTVSETGERHLFGIPCANIPGIASFVADPADCYLAVLIINRNDENVLKFLNILLDDMLADPTAAE